MDTQFKRALERMDELHMSAAEFARQMGELPQTINNWKKRGNIPGNKIFKAAEILRCSADWLSNGRGPVESGQLSLTDEPNQYPKRDNVISAGPMFVREHQELNEYDIRNAARESAKKMIKILAEEYNQKYTDETKLNFYDELVEWQMLQIKKSGHIPTDEELKDNVVFLDKFIKIAK